MTVEPLPPRSIALAGLLSLAVAMGIGRFAFTPLLPMMLDDGVLTLGQASWLATANYLGYLVGAVVCAAQPWWHRLWRGLPPVVHTVAVRGGLVVTVLLTLGLALPWPSAWPLWRFLAGVASAVVFVYTSGWCLARLAAAGAPRLGGVMYIGPGLGIALSGLAATAMVALGWSAQLGWGVFGVLAAVLTLWAWPHLQGTVPPAPQAAAQARAAGLGPRLAFVLAYGLAGFGYIVTATFLPVIARAALPGSVWLDLFWPLFGLSVAAGALLTTRLQPSRDRRHLLHICYLMQALGVGLTVWWPSLAGFALGSLLLGLPFTAITLFAMQEARRLHPGGASGFIGLLTAAYGLGQIAGPPMVAVLLARSAGSGGGTGAGFALSLQVAAGALLLGALVFGWLAHHYPQESNPHETLARSPRT